jgi:hypothetical protein
MFLEDILLWDTMFFEETVSQEGFAFLGFNFKDLTQKRSEI